MQRTTTDQKDMLPYDITEEPIVLSKHLIDLLLKQDNPCDCIGLYTFYYSTAKWQRTNQIWATTEFTANGLKWSVDRVRNTKKILKDLRLIEDTQKRDKDHKITKHYIKVNFVWSKSHPMEKPEGGFGHPVAKTDPNALSDNNKMLKVNKRKREEFTFSKFIKLFPNKWRHNKPFQESLKEFVEHRHAKGKILTELAGKKLVTKLIKFSTLEVIEAIDQSIESDWTSIFPKHLNGSALTYKETDKLPEDIQRLHQWEKK